jgi:hypothetical protein
VRPPADGVIAARIRTPINVQKTGDYPPPEEWSEAERATLRTIATLAGRFGYDV